jgi:hypothetical protein
MQWFRIFIVCGATACTPAVLASEPPVGAQFLQIDPLLVAQAEEVWRFVASPDNPIWPGWDASDTPILLYLPGIQDLLINHPDPPEGFVAYDGPVRFRGATMFVRSGRTHFELDGQNTSTDVNGTRTLVVADTLSNRKPNVISLLYDPRPVEEKIGTLSYESLRADPYGQMQTIAHEAFHVHQDLFSEGKHADEGTVWRYPTLSVENNVGFAMEGDWLVAALKAASPDRVRDAALNWLALRAHRRRALPPEAVAYEDGNEFAEGLAKYVEWRLLDVLEGQSPGERMHYAQGFAGYDDLQPQRDELLTQVGRNMRGEVNVNNDPYGVAPLRFRLYFSGMAVAALLDRISDDWKTRIFETGSTLTSLAASALGATDEELRERFGRLTSTDGYRQLTAQKAELRENGLVEIRRMVDAIDGGEGTLLVIDFSAIDEPDVAMSFTPFGVTRVDDSSAIYRMVPIAARVRPGAVFRQTVARDVLFDRDAKTFRFRLTETVSDEALLEALGLDAWPTGPFDVTEVELPGVSLTLGMATVERGDGSIVVRLVE